MQAPDHQVVHRVPRRRRQAGATVVEFALIVLVFLSFLFAIIELARMMFLFNTLQEVTRRAASAAAVSNLADETVMNDIRQHAIFRTSPGGLTLMDELTDRAIRIDYLSVSRGSAGAYTMQVTSNGALPASPAENRKNCVTDPYGANCVRLVRVRVCDPQVNGTCQPMKFKPLTSLFNVEISLPMATTIAKAQSFGAQVN